ncbi:hypothetical protein GRI62_04200 [Erythrobacter arachoides]|uniref:Uncharacterized protein n=1 Tax=Aurantiacibacter arachoides TaxID=1850444 RepID=A0A844ZZX2_9SPHN|nr:hypothetical protein [Aurantiacibacter arachoides]MXO92810.1 hypothetical protein [Aurantiacibacter arachoides]GGD54285.1 hypothetical protein GCM10011411_12780 [Aurantiacibacter arachoides]
MADSYEMCCERADAAALAASNAALDNVRDRELRAEKTWRGLAAKARSVVESREKVEREKLAERQMLARQDDLADTANDNADDGDDDDAAGSVAN